MFNTHIWNNHKFIFLPFWKYDFLSDALTLLAVHLSLSDMSDVSTVLGRCFETAIWWFQTAMTVI